MKPSHQLPARPETCRLDTAVLVFALGVVFWLLFYGISGVLEMVDLDSTPTCVIPHLENPRRCFSSELPGSNSWELPVRYGSCCLARQREMGFPCFLPPLATSPHPPASPCPSCPTSVVPISCAGTPGDFPAHVSLLVSRRSFSLGWMCLESEGKCLWCP